MALVIIMRVLAMRCATILTLVLAMVMENRMNMTVLMVMKYDDKVFSPMSVDMISFDFLRMLIRSLSESL